MSSGATAGERVSLLHSIAQLAGHVALVGIVSRYATLSNRYNKLILTPYYHRFALITLLWLERSATYPTRISFLFILYDLSTFIAKKYTILEYLLVEIRDET